MLMNNIVVLLFFLKFNCGWGEVKFSFLDLNPHLEPFSNCLINIVFFDYLKSDFEEFKYPVILGNYSVEANNETNNSQWQTSTFSVDEWRKKDFSKEYNSHMYSWQCK